MINMISTGNSSVDAVGMMDLTGNMIPNNWYNHVLRDNGKPNYLAILLLSEIVYWYKPVEIRDDETGKTIGYRKKFKSDCLQKSYDQLGRVAEGRVQETPDLLPADDEMKSLAEAVIDSLDLVIDYLKD